MSDRMYKVKFNFLNVTWVSLKFNFQLKTNSRAHVQSQIQFFEFDLSLTKIQFSTKKQSRSACSKSNSIFWVKLEFDYYSVFAQKPTQERMYKVKLNFLTVTWVSLKFNFQLETQSRSTCTKSNSFSWVWLEFDLNSIFQLKN